MGLSIKKISRLPLYNPLFVLSKLICLIRSWYYTTKVDKGGGKIKIQKPFLKLKIIKGKGATFSLTGNLIILDYQDLINPIYINLGDNALLQINGDFALGPGVRIAISTEASLIVGGKQNESASGITADTIIMVYKKIVIGKDFLCAWNVFISDSDWHAIEGQSHWEEVKIGNHVWVANSSSILKGTDIGDNCIIGSHSKLINKSFNGGTMIVGSPAKIVKEGINWKRDI